MLLTLDALKLDLPTTTNRIERFIKTYVEKSKAKGIVLGLSEGIDSSTTAALAAQAIGPNKVLALSLPERETYNPTDIRHTKQLAKKFRFNLQTIDITPILNAYAKTTSTFETRDKLAKGNLKARVRMTIIYYHANRLNKIVCGSSDKSETMMGYFTKWGDAAADISPLMDLYKTQVRQLASYIGIPKQIIKKPSTPMLWPGHLAEEELGIKYESLDLILLGLENFMPTEDIAHQLGLPLKRVNEIKARWLSKEHKRRAPLTIKLGHRTMGADFRLPYTPH